MKRLINMNNVCNDNEFKRITLFSHLTGPLKTVMSAAVPLAVFFIISVIISGAAGNDARVTAAEKFNSKAVMNLISGRADHEYIIGAGDLIKVFVYENSEYNDDYRIGPDGKMSMPVIGTIDAAGLDRGGLAAAIKNKLSRYITNPMVSVIISEYNNNFVYLFGDTGNPGRHDFKTRMDFLSILPQAKLDPSASGKKLKCDIIRHGCAVFTIDLSDYGSVLQNKLLLDLKLRNGDVLYFSVQDGLKGRVYILGAVKNPGIFTYDKVAGLEKLIKDGVELNSKTSRILKIIRKMPERILQFEYNLDRPRQNNPVIEDGDIVYVQQNYDKNFAYCIKEISPYIVVSLIGREAVRMARDK